MLDELGLEYLCKNLRREETDALPFKENSLT